MIEATLNLTGTLDFLQFGENLRFTKSIFPAGEQYIKINNDSSLESVRVNARCESSNDLMTIILAIDALKLEGFKRIELFLPYFPYARQDRMCNKGESFSLRTICNIFNAMGLTRIITYDVHSTVTGILLERHVDYGNWEEVRKFTEDFVLAGRHSIALIVPDAGAFRKAESLFNTYPSVFDKMVICRKKRDASGVYIDPIQDNIAGMKAVVVDDICDGGATFVALGERLTEAKVHSSHLFVSHGIFSAGLGELFDHYNTIATTNSFSTTEGRGDLPVYNLFR
jgi:ribose-phosphate pyrophosphokinase